MASVPTGRARSGRLRAAGALSLNFLLLAAACVLLAAALARLRVVVVPVVAALFLAALLAPLAGPLRSRGVPRTAVGLLVVVGFLLALAGLVALIVPRVAAELPGLQVAVQAGLRRVGDLLTEGLGLSPARVDRIEADILDWLVPGAGSVGETLVSGRFEGNLLYPIVVGHQVRLHPVAILLAFAVGAAVAGVLGALVAIPLAAVGGVVLDFYRDRQAHPPPAPEGGEGARA